MGGIIEVRKKLDAGVIPAEANAKFEIEKDDNVEKTYNVPDLPYQENTSNIHFDGVTHMAHIDIDDLTDAQLRSLHNNPDVQIVKKFGNP